MEADRFAGSTATKDTDYTVSPGTPTLEAGARRTTATVTAVVHSNTEADETVLLATKHDGETAFEFELRFSEEFPLGFTPHRPRGTSRSSALSSVSTRLRSWLFRARHCGGRG